MLETNYLDLVKDVELRNRRCSDSKIKSDFGAILNLTNPMQHDQASTASNLALKASLNI